MTLSFASPTNSQVSETSVQTGQTNITVSSHDVVQYVILLLLLFLLFLGVVFWLLRAELAWRRRINRDLTALRVSVVELRAARSSNTV